MPPSFLLRFFKWFCHPDLHPYIEGDLIELYQERVEQHGKKKADRRFLLDVLLLFRPGIIRPFGKRKTINDMALLKSNVKVGLRNLKRDTVKTAINVTSLAIGLAATFIMTLFILDELSYDKFHEDGERIYRISKRYFNGDKVVETVPFRTYLLDRMAEEVPLIESTTTLKPFGTQQQLGIGDKVFTENQVAFVDSNFFGFFSFPLLEGDRQSVLASPYTVAISKRKADEYFKDKSPIGETMTIEGAYDKIGFTARVTGVFEDMPQNSHFQFDLLVSMKTGELENERRGIYSFPIKYGYLKLHPAQHIAAVNELIPLIEEKYAPSFYADYDMHLCTQALFDIHLRSQRERELARNGDLRQIYIFSAIALLVLLIASFNYVNLTTAMATEKANEIGVRRTIGASRRQLIGQFLTEAGLTTSIALILAFIVIQIILPYFNAFPGKNLGLDLTKIRLLLAFLSITTAVSLLAGIYPALVLSGTRLKLTLSRMRTSSVRRALVVLQFGISSILIIGSIVIFNQWRMLSNQQYSFQPEEILNIPVSSLQIRNNYPLIKEELLRHPEIKMVAGSNKDFIAELKSFNGLTLPGREGYIDMYYATIDADFFDLYDKKMINGRNFIDYSADSLGGIILNEAAVKLLGYTADDVLGLKLEVYDGYSPQVIGVTEDFQYQSLHGKVVPMYFQLLQSTEVEDQLKVITVKLNTDRLSTSLAAIQDIFKQFDENATFDYSFLEEDIELAYQEEERFSQILALMTIIGILIACMGVFGITTAIAHQRQKEFGVRKVLGASSWNISFLINQDFFKLILLANVLGFPLAYLVTQHWLQNFAARIEVGFPVFVISLLCSCGVVILGSSYWSLKAATSNPVDSIKNIS